MSERPSRRVVILGGLATCATAASARDDTEFPMTGAADPAFASFDATLRDFMQLRKVPGGALAVVKDGRLVYARGFGYADVEKREPVQPTSLFRIASLSKQLTATALMTLEQRHERSLLDTPAFSYIDEQPLLTGGAKVDPRLNAITVRQLLRHTGGFDRDASFDPMFRSREIADANGTPCPADQRAIIRYMMGRPLDFDPGTRYAYSNFGYCVLGRIIEKLSGVTYATYVRDHVLTPMGIQLMRLGRTLRSMRAPGEATYYQPNSGTATSLFPEEPGRVPWPYGAFCLEAMDSHGGWLASAIDLARFAARLDFPNGHPVLNERSLQATMERPAAPVGRNGAGNPTPTYYGFGWSVRPVGKTGKANLWHTGSLPGTFTLMVRRWDGLTWVVLFNQRSEGSTPSDNAIDGALHRAAAAVPKWPDHDLFAG